MFHVHNISKTCRRHNIAETLSRAEDRPCCIFVWKCCVVVCVWQELFSIHICIICDIISCFVGYDVVLMYN